MRVSLKKVAERAGVTGAAVSMALRDNPRISKARREEVKRIALEMGYKPNLLARGLVGGKTHSIGIVMAGLGGGAPPATMDITRSIMLDVIDRQYLGSIADSMSGKEAILWTLTDFIGRRFDGVVFQNWTYCPLEKPFLSLLMEFPSAVVIANRKESLALDQVVHDREPAIEAAAEYLVRTGRKMPVIVCVNDPKAKMYIRKFEQCGINVRADAIIEEPGYSKNYGVVREAMEERLGGGKVPFDVLICNNDVSATMAMSWARSKGLRVPEDVAVIGFDNQDTSEYLLPPLASVDRQSEEVARLASMMVFNRLENPDSPPCCETVPMRFVLRESAG